MAMTKEDYMKLGELSFRNGGVCVEGTSWQARAEQTGYYIAQQESLQDNQEHKAEELAVHNEIMNSNTQVEVIRVSNQVAQVLQKAGEGAIVDYLKDYAARVRPAMHHAKQLEEMALTEKCGKRFIRLLDKAKAIRRRYSIA